MTVVGSAEIIIRPTMIGFAGVGAKARAELGPVGTAASAAGAGLTKAEKGAQDFGLGLSSMGSKVGGAIGAIGKLSLIAGAGGVTFALIDGAKASDKFEASITRLNTQAGVSKYQLGTLGTGVLTLAGQVGANPDSLSEALFHVESNFSSLGISAPKALSLVKIAAEGAKIGNANLVDVTNALTAAVASGIPGVQNFSQAMGILNATVGSGDMSMQNLADAFGTGMVAVVKGYGLSITDVGAALAVFGDNNIRGAQAGTALRVAIQALAVPAKGGADALAKLGLKSDTLATDMQSGGLLKAMTDLHDRMNANGIAANQQGLIITEAFGKKAGTGINILADQFDRLKSKYPDLAKGAGNFAGAWVTAQKTTSQKLDVLKGSFDTLLINVGKSTQGIQGKLATMGTDVLTKISAFVSGAGKGFSDGPLKQGLSDLGSAAHSLGRIIVDLGPAFKNLATLAGGAFLAALHVVADVLGVIAGHGTILRTVLYAMAAGWALNRIAITGLAVAQAIANVQMLIMDIRTSSMTVALGANSAAVTGNLIGTRLLTAAWNSSLVTVLRTTVAWTANKVAMLASAVASKALAAATWLVNAAMDANPITLIVIALVALGVGIYEAYKHFGPFRDVVKAVGAALESAALATGRFFTMLWRNVVGAFEAVTSFVVKWWPAFLVVMTGGAALVPLLIVKYWTQIKDFTVRIFTDITGFIDRHWRLLLVIFAGPLGLIVVLVVNFWHQISGFIARMAADVAGFTSRMWHDVAGFFGRMYSDAVGFTSRMWHDVAGFFGHMYADVSGWASRTYHDVATFFSRMYNDAAGFTSRMWHDVAGFFGRMYADVSGWTSRLYNDVAGFFSRMWRDTTNFAIRTWHDVSAPFVSMWHDVSGFTSQLWRDVTGWFGRIRDDTTNSVKTATGWIRAAWEGLREIFKAPINFVINTVYNAGIRPVWNFLADIVHESHLPAARGLARGGRLPGFGGGDVLPAMLEPGEAVVPKHLVPEMAPWAHMRGIPGFSLGGIAGAIGHTIAHPLSALESLGSGTLSILGSAVHWVRGALAGAVNAMLAPVRAAIHHTLGTGHDWSGTAGQMMLLPLDKIVAIARGQDKTDAAAMSAAGSAGGAARWAGVFSNALALAGQSASWLGLGLKRMNQESGGNPTAVNRTDSNWAAGTPSVGLMQVIGPTFARYAGPYRNTGPFLYGTSTNPLANIYAAIEYTQGAYGSLSAWGRPGGYDTGNGKRWPSGTMGINESGEDEFVWRRSQLGTGGVGDLNITVDARGATDPGAIRAAVAAGGTELMAQLVRLMTAGAGAR